MTAQREPEELVRALADERVPSEPLDAQARRREQIVPLVARAIRQARVEEEQRTRKRRWAVVAAAAVVVFGGAGLSLRSYHLQQRTPVAVVTPSGRAASVRAVSGTLVVTHAGRARVVPSSELPELSGGDELRTAADGNVLIQTERSAIHIEPATQVSVIAPSAEEERIRLALGTVDLKVSKQPQSRRSVVVETPNAEVVVHGTMFSVSVGSEHDVAVTRVRVTEGSVWVLHGGNRELIAAGDEWASNAEKARAAKPELAPPKPETSAAASEARRVAPNSAAAARAASSLSEENRLFQTAVDARNRGDDPRALEAFATLLGRYPSGRLAEEARVERMRALRRTGNAAAAAAEARRYLAEHPRGYAQEEARSAALGTGK